MSGITVVESNEPAKDFENNYIEMEGFASFTIVTKMNGEGQHQNFAFTLGDWRMCCYTFELCQSLKKTVELLEDGRVNSAAVKLRKIIAAMEHNLSQHTPPLNN